MKSLFERDRCDIKTKQTAKYNCSDKATLKWGRSTEWPTKRSNLSDISCASIVQIGNFRTEKSRFFDLLSPVRGLQVRQYKACLKQMSIFSEAELHEPYDPVVVGLNQTGSWFSSLSRGLVLSANTCLKLIHFKRIVWMKQMAYLKRSHDCDSVVENSHLDRMTAGSSLLKGSDFHFSIFSQSFMYASTDSIPFRLTINVMKWLPRFLSHPWLRETYLF